LQPLCTNGDPAACAGVALLELQGKGGPRDTQSAVHHLEQACAHNVIEACCGLVHADCPSVNSPSCILPEKAGAFSPRSTLRFACKSDLIDHPLEPRSNLWGPLGREWMFPYLREQCDDTYRAACRKLLAPKEPSHP
jgi:hypothetical protein